MDIYDSDNLDRDMYDSKEQQHYYESLDWSDNVFGESLPGQGDDDMSDDTDVTGDEDMPADMTDEDMADEDAEDEEEVA